jgi:hypothetical protein
MRLEKQTPAIFVCGIFLFTAVAQAQYGGGSGTPGDPYQISTIGHLNQLANTLPDYDDHYILTADIFFAGWTGKRIGNQTTQFTGTFDGNGHVLDANGQTFSFSTTSDYGLFGWVNHADAEIRDLTIVSLGVNGGASTSNIGTLVGQLENGTVRNCHVQFGTVSGSFALGGLVGRNKGAIIDCSSSAGMNSGVGFYKGGLVGYNDGGTITNCHATGTVWGTDYVGGLLGFGWPNSQVNNCYATGNATGTSHVGGLVGYHENSGVILNCFATGTVQGSSVAIGGLVGTNINSSTISLSYATGPATTALWQAGGLVGSNRGGSTITNCYAVGAVQGTTNETGGLVGTHRDNTSAITNCYATGKVIRTTVGTAGGLVGSNLSSAAVNNSFWDSQNSGQLTSAGGTGKSGLEIRQQATFTDAGWDFTSTWAIVESQTAPFFLGVVGDLNNDGFVDLFDLALFAQNWL